MLIHTNKDLNYCNQAEKNPVGTQRNIACCSWTTASGKIIPLWFKMEDEDGIIRTFNKLHLNYSEKKMYAGISSYEFDCNLIVDGLTIHVSLIHYPDTGKWVLVESSVH